MNKLIIFRRPRFLLCTALVFCALASFTKPLTFVTYHATSQYYPTMSANAIFNAVPYGGKLILKVEPELEKLKARKSLKTSNLVAEGDVQFGGTPDTKGTLSLHNVSGRAKGLEAVDAHIQNLYLYGLKFPNTTETMSWQELTLENGYTATFLTMGTPPPQQPTCRHERLTFTTYDGRVTYSTKDIDGFYKNHPYTIGTSETNDLKRWVPDWQGEFLSTYGHLGYPYYYDVVYADDYTPGAKDYLSDKARWFEVVRYYRARDPFTVDGSYNSKKGYEYIEQLLQGIPFPAGPKVNTLYNKRCPGTEYLCSVSKLYENDRNYFDNGRTPCLKADLDRKTPPDFSIYANDFHGYNCPADECELFYVDHVYSPPTGPNNSGSSHYDIILYSKTVECVPNEPEYEVIKITCE